MLNILWVEDDATDEKKNRWFKNRVVTLITDFSQAEQEITSYLNKYDVVVLDINLENSDDRTDAVSKYAKSLGMSSTKDFLKKAGINLYFFLLENGFPKERILFLTANANNQTSHVNDLKQAFEGGDDERFDKVLMDITNSFGDKEKTKAFGFIDQPDGYSKDDVYALCNYLESKVSLSEEPNTYEKLLEAAKDCRIINVPMACIKGTDQLNIELKKHEANKYLVLRRGIIESCEILSRLIDHNEEVIQFRDFIKLENNVPAIEISDVEVKNYLDTLSQSLSLCTRQKIYPQALTHVWRAIISGFCPSTTIMSGGHKNNTHSLSLSSIFWRPCKRLSVR